MKTRSLDWLACKWKSATFRVTLEPAGKRHLKKMPAELKSLGQKDANQTELIGGGLELRV